MPETNTNYRCLKHSWLNFGIRLHMPSKLLLKLLPNHPNKYKLDDLINLCLFAIKNQHVIFQLFKEMNQNVIPIYTAIPMSISICPTLIQTRNYGYGMLTMPDPHATLHLSIQDTSKIKCYVMI